VLIGILALQGNFAMHKKVLDSLNVNSNFVKYESDLHDCDALIIPGGESTTITKLIDEHQLRDAIIAFSKEKPILGTCAGMIMLSNSPKTKNVSPLGILDFEVSRNGWGRQVYSFTQTVTLDIDEPIEFQATFIRAPKVQTFNEDLIIHGKLNDEVIYLSDGFHMATSFHPEFGNDSRVHQYFLSKINSTSHVNTI
jgi:5'-phosphate synthase pdxT subunit